MSVYDRLIELFGEIEPPLLATACITLDMDSYRNLMMDDRSRSSLDLRDPNPRFFGLPVMKVQNVETIIRIETEGGNDE